MTIGDVYFGLCSSLCVLGALSTVIARNPIRGAMGLLLTIVGIAGLFIQLQAQFLAAIQVIVYAGAVVVLFVFAIMLLGTDAVDRGGEVKSSVARAIGGASIAFGVMAALVLIGPKVAEHPTRFSKVAADHGSVSAMGSLLFTTAIVPFELATALLVVAVVGAIALARPSWARKVAPSVSHATRRLFAGPVVPKDVANHSAGDHR